MRKTQCNTCRFSLINNEEHIKCDTIRIKRRVYYGKCDGRRFWEPAKLSPIPKVIPKYSDNTYYFQGPINFYHLCEEARQSGKFAFLAISGDKLYFGFSRQVSDTLTQKYKKDFLATRIHDTYLPFHIFTCNKNYTTLLMDRLKDIPKEVKKTRRKVAKALYKEKLKGNFSNKPSTKIMVF